MSDWDSRPRWRTTLYVAIAIAALPTLGLYLPRAAEADWTASALAGLAVEIVGNVLIWWGVAALAAKGMDALGWLDG